MSMLIPLSMHSLQVPIFIYMFICLKTGLSHSTCMMSLVGKSHKMVFLMRQTERLWFLVTFSQKYLLQMHKLNVMKVKRPQ